MVCSNVSPESLGGIDRAAADFRELGERAAKRGLRVGFEALAWGSHINDYRDAWEVVRRADHPAVGLVLDTFHMLRPQDRLEAAARYPRRPDLPGAARRRALARHGRAVIGAGISAASRARAKCRCLNSCEAVLATGYDGEFSLEDLQRPVPRRLAARDRRRWSALADLSDGPVARQAGCRQARNSGDAAALAMPRRRIHRICRRRSHRRRTRRVSSPVSAFSKHGDSTNRKR